MLGYVGDELMINLINIEKQKEFYDERWSQV